MLIDAPKPGTWVLVHKGIALQTVTETQAREVNDALAALGRVLEGEGVDDLFPDLVGREPQLPPHLQAPSVHRTDGGEA